MANIGFSTGALARGDFRRGLDILRRNQIYSVELCALRSSELEPLIQSIDTLGLEEFSYVSFHAPSKFDAEEEWRIVEHLGAIAERGWNIIVHPDSITQHELWKQFGNLLLIENMDKRKPIGRNKPELESIFDSLPEASFCFDIGHASQVDPTMSVAYTLLKTFGDRLKEVHISYVNTQSGHERITYDSILSFKEVADLIPTNIQVIIESSIGESEISSEIRSVHMALQSQDVYA